MDDLSKKSRYRVAVQLSPLCRITEYNLAEELIRNGLESGNISDWQQQQLGIASSTQTNSLTIEHIKACINAPRCSRRYDVVLAGCDRGRQQDWLTVVAYHLPVLWREMHVQQILDSTIQTLLFGGDVTKTDIPRLLTEHGVEFGLVDNEPDRDGAAALAQKTALELADQKPNLIDDIKQDEVYSGGINYPCWFINNNLFLTRTLNVFLNTDENGHPLMRLPTDWDVWLNNPSELSPIRHLTGPSLDPETGKWTRADGGIDDIFYSLMFNQAAFFLWLTKWRNKSEPPSQIGQAQKRIHRISMN